MSTTMSASALHNALDTLFTSNPAELRTQAEYYLQCATEYQGRDSYLYTLYVQRSASCHAAAQAAEIYAMVRRTVTNEGDVTNEGEVLPCRICIPQRRTCRTVSIWYPTPNQVMSHRPNSGITSYTGALTPTRGSNRTPVLNLRVSRWCRICAAMVRQGMWVTYVWVVKRLCRTRYDDAYWYGYVVCVGGVR